MMVDDAGIFVPSPHLNKSLDVFAGKMGRVFECWPFPSAEVPVSQTTTGTDIGCKSGCHSTQVTQSYFNINTRVPHLRVCVCVCVRRRVHSRLIQYCKVTQEVRISRWPRKTGSERGMSRNCQKSKRIIMISLQSDLWNFRPQNQCGSPCWRIRTFSKRMQSYVVLSTSAHYHSTPKVLLSGKTYYLARPQSSWFLLDQVDRKFMTSKFSGTLTHLCRNHVV